MGLSRVKLGTLGVACSILALAGCSAILGGGGYTTEDTSGDSGAGNDATASDSNSGSDTNAPQPDSPISPGPDACATVPTSKGGFESNLCNGQTCAPGDNSAVLDSGYCTQTSGIITCTIPQYTPPDAGPPPDTGAPDAAPDTGDDGGGDDGSVDASPPPPVDAGPALPSCFDLAGNTNNAAGFNYPSPVKFAIGSTAIQPYVGSIAQEYANGLTGEDGGTFAATIVYVGTGSCVGVEASYAPPASTREPMVAAMARNGVAKGTSAGKPVYLGTYYDPKPTSPGTFPTSYFCAIDPASPTDSAYAADVGFSDVFPSSCTTLPYAPPGEPLTNNAFEDLPGPVQVMELVVPVKSPVSSITYEQAQLVWGYGGAAGITPWTDSAFLFRRTAGSGTQTMIGAAIGLDPRVWKGVSNTGSPAVLAELENVVNHGLPDGGTGDPTANIPKALGILSSDFTDDNRTVLKPLAFQDRGESCAWLPDSSASSFDKRNVRDGHYPIWGPSHMIASVQGGVPSDPVINRLYAALNGLDPILSTKLDVIALYAAHHIVPTCAMHVSRSSDGQDYSSSQPLNNTSCSCYYDSVVPLDSPDPECTTCTTNADCKDPARSSCNVFGGKGFCEPLGPLH